jgi:chorismate mutase
MTASRPTVFGSPRMLIASIMALAVLLTVGCSPTATQTVTQQESAPDASVAADIDRLLGLMRQRLLVMHEVARWKWHHRQPITDTTREAALLERTSLRAHELGLDAELAVHFMKAQIAAGRQVQQQDMEGWQTQPSPQDKAVPDLATELRPKIDQLNLGLLDALARLAPHLDDEQVRRRLRVSAAEAWASAGFSGEISATALEPLLTGGKK